MALLVLVDVVVAAECDDGQVRKALLDLVTYFNGFCSAEFKVQYHQVRLFCGDDVQEVRGTVIGGVYLEAGITKGDF